MKLWHASALDQLSTYFEQNEDVLGLFLFGSLSSAAIPKDYWSDIDVLVVVKDHVLSKFFPAVDWIDFFGTLYTYDQSSDNYKCTTRACFENFNRIDFVFTTEEKLAWVAEWESLPFATGLKTIFSRTQSTDRIVQQRYSQQPISSVTEKQFFEMARGFRFKSTLAIIKVVRDDLLIALHLTQDLIRDCCVLGMMLRDRKTGTNIHKQGGEWNQLVTQLSSAQQPFTAFGTLESIKESNLVFEKLAREWSSEYRADHHLLLDWIEKAKDDLRK